MIMENNQIYGKSPASCSRVPERSTATRQSRMEIVDNRPLAATHRRLVGSLPIQRYTDINYTTQTLTIGGKSCIVGRVMTAHLDPADPVKGTATSGKQENIMKLLGRSHLRGHLLNHDLGGLGIASNLFPITTPENGTHKDDAERYVKNSLGAGNDVYYMVQAQNSTTNYNTPKEFKDEHPGFNWGANNTGFPVTLGRTSLTGLASYNVESNPWEHTRRGLPNTPEIQNTLTKTKIDGTVYDYDDLTNTYKNLNNGH